MGLAKKILSKSVYIISINFYFLAQQQKPNPITLAQKRAQPIQAQPDVRPDAYPTIFGF